MTRVARLHPPLRVIQGDAHCPRESEVRAHFDREAEPCSMEAITLLYVHMTSCPLCTALWDRLEAEEERWLEKAETLDGSEEE